MPMLDEKFRYFDWGAFETLEPDVPPVPPIPTIANPHYFWAGPSSGVDPGAATFRLAVPGDLPFAAMLNLPNLFSDVNTLAGLRVGGRTVTANTTLVAQEFEILVNATSNPVTVALPFATGTRQFFRIKRVDASANIVTIQPRPGELIDGDSAITLSSQYDGVTLIDGATGYWDQSSSVPIPEGVALLAAQNIFTDVNQFSGVRFVPQIISDASYAIQPTDFGILAIATDSSILLTLPPATGSGQLYHIKKIDGTANVVTVDADGTDLIDGSVSVNLVSQWSDCLLYDAAVGYWDNIGASGAAAGGGFDLPLVLPGMRIKADGFFQLWNPDQSKYHTLLVHGAAGEEYITLGAGEA